MSDEPRIYRCRLCGIVREAVQAPWCRHGDLHLPATRMVLAESWHPFYDARSTHPGMEWLAGR